MSVRSCLVVVALAVAMLVLPTSARASEPESLSAARIDAIERAGAELRIDEAVELLRHGETLLPTDDAIDGLLEMLTAYVRLENLYFWEAGALYLRSWLVEELDKAGLVDELAWLRSRGRVVTYPRAVLPSVWYVGSLVESEDREGFDNAVVKAMTEQGFRLLSDGDIGGLVVLLRAHELAVWSSSNVPPASVALRSELVGLLEVGGFCELADELRQKGDEYAVSRRDRARYEAIWLGIAPAGELPRQCKVEPAPFFRRHLMSVEPAPVILTTFGGGSYTKQRLGVIGGDVLAGASFMFVDTAEKNTLVLIPSIGWSGWRTRDKPVSLRANTFTGRVDFGYMNFRYLQGLTVFGAGRIGTGRGPERDRDPFMLYGAQVGVTYWPLTGYVPHAGILGLEFQSNYSNYLGEWHNDLRFMVTLNLSVLFVPVYVYYSVVG
jgi:hypothetical protein